MEVFKKNRTLNCNGRLVMLDVPRVMGILNVTDDSFYDGGQFNERTTALHHVEKMLKAGATFIDVGGMSTRPGAKMIDTSLEMERAIPIVEAIQREFPDAIISIDTMSSSVASTAIDAGASIVNDISGGTRDPRMIETVANSSVPFILMHMKGRPESMQNNPMYEDIALEVLDFFIAQTQKCRAAGINDVIVDPGFGFGKTVEHNYTLLNKLEVFNMLQAPILIGVSRKSMIYKLLETSADRALNGTTAVHMAALLKGADILRVHDVAEAMECIGIYKSLSSS